ncbi:O-antigen ligase [Flavobacterium sp. CLA17]|uniref:O-antigen ligase family protein n=1 Tax=Flavobacterium sp. CLA17 TaxID=2724135 RepID=UPI001492587A|nr:O-antigen ligase family protein [Flavobacterium sp. CLA17]QSB27959.1 O-antigen ligase family protein [Flavobacterium sp. CLA17]
MIDKQEVIHPYKILDFYYYIIIGILSLGMFIPGVRIGVIASVIILFLMYKYLRTASLLKNYVDVLVMIYILYNTISFLWFIFSGLPISVFIKEYSNSILPMFFYYLGKIEDKDNKNFYNITLNAIVLCFVLGFILFIQQPYYYREYLSVLDGIGGTDPILTSSAFRSLVGLTMTGSLGVVGVLISFTKILDTKGRNGKAALIICMIAVALTFRRSALFVALAAFFVLHYYGYFKFGMLKKKYLLIEIAIIFFIVGYLNNNFGDLITMLNERLMMITDSIDERSDTWIEGLMYGNLVIGSGLGVFGHKAVEFSDKYIPDGNYVRMLAELGVIGTFIFFSIIITTLFKGLKKLKENILEVGIILGLCIQAVGSDIFSFQLIVPILWFSVGRVNINYK